MTDVPLLRRLPGLDRASVPFTLDGQACTGCAGDTLLSAVLAEGARLRLNEAGGGPRAGFCNMGACQDCWVRLADGRRMRACTTLLEPGMAVVTEPSP